MSENLKRTRVALVIGLLALLTFAAFWRVFNADFVEFDDPLYVTENLHVQHGLNWEGVKWAFTSSRASNWHPLTWLSHMTDCSLFGLQPRGPHLVNLLLHLANTLLLFSWLRRLTGAFWKSAIVAALFALHPAHVESVAWVAERKDVLSTFFLLLTLIAYQKFQVQGSRFKVWYGVALLCFLFALLAKPMVVTLPFILLLIDFWDAESRDAKSITKLPWVKWTLQKLPFFFLTAASCAVTYWAQNRGGAVVTTDRLSVYARVANALVSYTRYLGELFWPTRLAVFYPFPVETWSEMTVAGAAGLLLAVSRVALSYSRRRPWLAAGWFWFLGTLVPVIGFVQVGSQAMADRYSYVPSIGIFIMLVWGLAELAERRALRLQMAGAAALAVGACAVLTYRQVGCWHDSEALFKSALQNTENNVVSMVNLGTYLWEQNRPDEALPCFKDALRINPHDVEALVNVGEMAREKGDLGSAAEQLSKALELNPRNPVAQFDLAKTLLKQGTTSDALAHFREAIGLEPDMPEFHSTLAAALAELGDLEGEATEYTIAERLNPSDPVVVSQLAGVLQKQKKIPEAIGLFRRAMRIYQQALEKQPDSLGARNNLAWLLATNPNAEIRNGAEAVKLAEATCEMDKREHAVFMGTLAAAYAETGRFDEAIATAGNAKATALKAGEKTIADKNGELLKLYQAHKPCRE